jgi:hypothetical protein
VCPNTLQQIQRNRSKTVQKKRWYQHVPQSVETSQQGILWKQQVQTDRTVPNNTPDITIRDNEKETCVLIDVAFQETEM